MILGVVKDIGLSVWAKNVLQNNIQLKDLVSKGDTLLLLHCIRSLLNDAFQQFELFGGRRQRHHDFSDWELLGASAHLSSRFEDGARLHPGELLMNCSKQIEPTKPTEVKTLIYLELRPPNKFKVKKLPVSSSKSFQ